MTRARTLLLTTGLVSVLSLSGCRTFAGTVGVGLGLGAEVQVGGLAHAGLLGFVGVEGGSYYGHAPSWTYFGTLGLLHYESNGFKSSSWNHSCFGLLPGVFSTGKNHHPWAFEVSVAALFFHVRLGWDPAALFVPHGEQHEGEQVEEPELEAGSLEGEE